MASSYEHKEVWKASLENETRTRGSVRAQVARQSLGVEAEGLTVEQESSG